MAANNYDAEIKELQNRMEWLDNERRKANRKVAELEQKFELQRREIKDRDDRIKALEEQLSTATARLSRISQIDTKLDQFRDEMVAMIEQYDQRRLKAEEELDRLRRVEHENTARELADIRKELPAIPRLQQEMEERKAEEGRLANLIGVEKSKLSLLSNQVEEWERALAFLEEKEKQNSRNISDIQTSLMEINKRWAPINERMDQLNSNMMRLESMITPLTGLEDDLKERLHQWTEQIQMGEHERNKQIENWRYVLEEHADTLERFSQEWIAYSDQYKEAKMAVQTISDWQEQIEKQQRETAELLRIETHRLQSRWDNFQQELNKQLKHYEIEAEQRWHTVDRQTRQTQEQFADIEEALAQIQQDKDLIWRIQSAQADAMKKIPRIWLEEIEKARKQDPNRRRQPALVPVREE
jgi:chromosome segregation ATPase